MRLSLLDRFATLENMSMPDAFLKACLRPIWLAVVLMGAAAGWNSVLRADETSATAHPIVPGFERFHSDPAADPVQGGRLLLGELGCTSCHRADDSQANQLLPKQAPILDGVGGRVHPEFLQAFLADPHQVKPGTTMPDLLAGLSPNEKQEHVAALTHFLASTGSLKQSLANRQAARRGEGLFHRLGCAACHDSQQPNAAALPTSVPLGRLDEKYSLPSLTAFLQDPLRVRPSGRMPDLNLTDKEALEIASHFLRNVEVPPNMTFALYDGRWDELPNFDGLNPKQTGTVAGFDISLAGKTNRFGIRFEGFLHIERAGDYRFHLGSDDGSRLFIDGKRIIDNDGLQAHTVRSGSAKLQAGMHPLRVDYFQADGDMSLDLEYEGPGVSRQPATGAISLVAEKQTTADANADDAFVLQPELVEKGRRLFATVGCASCHQLRENDRPIASQLKARPLSELQSNGGCLDSAPSQKSPHYRLSTAQQSALKAALAAKSGQLVGEPERIHQTLMAFNCYACHQRGEIGGVEQARNSLFQTTIQEMGDEGRIPPHLTGVGDKLTTAWLKHVLSSGANDRPYMLTRMPKFGDQNVGHLVQALAAVDLREEAEIPQIDLPEHRVESIGRHLVGEKALSCIKCHNFGPHKATGLQSMDLTTMTRRLREDWFHRYMLNPQVYRPGTRMPAPWPFGQTTVRDVLDADVAQQIAAVWTYLKAGDKAGVPVGLVRQAIELTPEDEPILYRNFIAGVSPRAIAVGYPEQANLAFDANSLSLRLIWHGAFIDASRHWSGRGQGFQPPLGDHIMHLVDGAPFAVLKSTENAWPTDAPKELGYRFRGYRLDADRRPVFQYAYRNLLVEDHPQPVARPDEQYPALRRTLSLTTDAGAPAFDGPLWFRAAAGKSIEASEDGWYLVDGAMKVRVTQSHRSKATPAIVRHSGERFELLLPIEWADQNAEIVQEFIW
jgi:mono/diheme cytochrome c family protein